MNGYDLTASLFASLVSLGWPIALIVCVYLFRERLQEILPRLQFKHKDTEISFQIEAAKVHAETIPLPIPGETREAGSNTENVEALAGQSPEAAILWTWVNLEAKIRSEAKRLYQVDTSSRRSIVRVMQELQTVGGIDRQTANLVVEMSAIRNMVAHPETNAKRVGTEDALNYLDLATRVSAAIEAMPSEGEILAAMGLPYADDGTPTRHG